MRIIIITILSGCCEDFLTWYTYKALRTVPMHVKCSMVLAPFYIIALATAASSIGGNQEDSDNPCHVELMDWF